MGPNRYSTLKTIDNSHRIPFHILHTIHKFLTKAIVQGSQWVQCTEYANWYNWLVNKGKPHKQQTAEGFHGFFWMLAGSQRAEAHPSHWRQKLTAEESDPDRKMPTENKAQSTHYLSMNHIHLWLKQFWYKEITISICPIINNCISSSVIRQMQRSYTAKFKKVKPKAF